MFIVWRGHGWWVTWIALLAMVVPMAVVRRIDGPEVDQGVSLAMAVAAAATLLIGLRLNRGRGPAAHSFWGLPFQFWAVPMLVFSVLLGSGTITTAEAPRPAPPADLSKPPAR